MWKCSVQINNKKTKWKRFEANRNCDKNRCVQLSLSVGARVGCVCLCSRTCVSNRMIDRNPNTDETCQVPARRWENCDKFVLSPPPTLRFSFQSDSSLDWLAARRIYFGEMKLTDTWDANEYNELVLVEMNFSRVTNQLIDTIVHRLCSCVNEQLWHWPVSNDATAAAKVIVNFQTFHCSIQHFSEVVLVRSQFNDPQTFERHK